MRAHFPVRTGPAHTGDLQFLADSWDGPLFRAHACGLNDFRSSPPPHAMFMDAMEPEGCWEYVLSGTIHYRLGSERYRIETGQALVTRRPDPGWMLRPYKDVPVQTLWITVRGSLALEVFDFLHHRFGQIQSFSTSSPPVRLMRRLVQLVRAEPHRSAHFWSQKIFQFLTTWWRYGEEHGKPLGNRELKAVKPSRLISYGPKTVKGFASQMGYSRSYLTRKLTRQWHRSPGKVLREVRLRDAASLLRGSAMNVGEIASKVGYATTASFSRAFSTQYGISPRDYRMGNGILPNALPPT